MSVNDVFLDMKAIHCIYLSKLCHWFCHIISISPIHTTMPYAYTKSAELIQWDNQIQMFFDADNFSASVICCYCCALLSSLWRLLLLSSWSYICCSFPSISRRCGRRREIKMTTNSCHMWSWTAHICLVRFTYYYILFYMLNSSFVLTLLKMPWKGLTQRTHRHTLFCVLPRWWMRLDATIDRWFPWTSVLRQFEVIKFN